MASSKTPKRVLEKSLNQTIKNYFHQSIEISPKIPAGWCWFFHGRVIKHNFLFLLLSSRRLSFCKSTKSIIIKKFLETQNYGARHKLYLLNPMRQDIKKETQISNFLLWLESIIIIILLLSATLSFIFKWSISYERDAVNCFFERKTLTISWHVLVNSGIYPT